MNPNLPTIEQQALPTNPQDLYGYIVKSREALAAIRTHWRSYAIMGFSSDVNNAYLSQAQDFAEHLIDAEVQLGIAIAALPTTKGKHPDMDSGLSFQTREQLIAELGLSYKQAKYFQLMAANQNTVQAAKAEARARGAIVNQAYIVSHIINEKHNAARPNKK